MIYDDVDGFNFLREFGRVEEAFANPAVAGDRRNRQVLLDYLKDSGIPSRLVERLAARDPRRADQLFQVVLKQPDFSWERDGAALLHRHKARYYEQPVLPSVTLLGHDLARAQITETAAAGKERATSRQPRRGGKARRRR